MFDVFGEMDSAAQINELAANLLAEGDTKALYELAAENGIEAEDVDDYIELQDKLVTPLMAAYGKLNIESGQLKPEEIVEDWITYIKISCQESGEMAAAVRKRGKTLQGCIASLLNWSFKHAYPIDKDICKEAGVAGSVKMGIPGMAHAKKLISEYYLGTEA